jgi:hypothetical protein
MRMRQTARQIANKWRGDGTRSETRGTVLMDSKNNVTECHVISSENSPPRNPEDLKLKVILLLFILTANGFYPVAVVLQ